MGDRIRKFLVYRFDSECGTYFNFKQSGYLPIQYYYPKLFNPSRRSLQKGARMLPKPAASLLFSARVVRAAFSADVSCQSHAQRCCWYVGHANWWYRHTNAKHNPIKRIPNARASAVMITADNESLHFACWTPVTSLWTKPQSGDRWYGQTSAEHLEYNMLGTQLDCVYAALRCARFCCFGYGVLLLYSTQSCRTFND